jgi:hypothetical protein
VKRSPSSLSVSRDASSFSASRISTEHKVRRR